MGGRQSVQNLVSADLPSSLWCGYIIWEMRAIWGVGGLPC